MPAFPDLDAARLLTLLQDLAILFFVAGGAPFVTRRRGLRRLALAAYGCALALALAWVVIWLTTLSH